MKFSALREKNPSVEEGLVGFENGRVNSVTIQTNKNSNWVQYIQFMKVTFCVVIVLLVVWLGVSTYVEVNPNHGNVFRKYVIHMLPKSDKNSNDSKIIAARDFSQMTIMDEQSVQEEDTPTDQFIESFNQQQMNFIEPKIDESETDRSVNVEKDNVDANLSKDEMIEDKFHDNELTLTQIKNLESLKHGLGDIDNIKRDNDETDSSMTKIVSNENSGVSFTQDFKNDKLWKWFNSAEETLEYYESPIDDYYYDI